MMLSIDKNKESFHTDIPSSDLDSGLMQRGLAKNCSNKFSSRRTLFCCNSTLALRARCEPFRSYVLAMRRL